MPNPNPPLKNKILTPSNKAKLAGHIFLISCGALLASCGNDHSPAATSQAASGKALTMGAYRVRTDESAELNGASWGGPINTPTKVNVDEPFRLRVEVENKSAEQVDHHFTMQYRLNAGNWQPLTAEDFPYPVKEKVIEFEEASSASTSLPFVLEHGSKDSFTFKEDDDYSYVQVSSNSQALLAVGDYHTHWGPIEYKAALRLGESAQAGIVFGYQDKDNFYRLNMKAGGGISISQHRDGSESVLQQMNFDVEVKTNQWMEVGVVIEDKEVSVEYEWDPIITGVEWSGELAEAPPASVIGLYLPQNSSVDLVAMEVSTDAQSPLVSIVSNDAYSSNASTADVLPGSELPFVAGSGISFAPVTPTWRATQAHGEWEIPMVLRYFADGAKNTLDGDRFEFRLIDEKGTPLAAANYPTVVANVPNGHLGGTFVETPARLGPWQTEDGDLYFLMEPSETDNMMMIVKSTDGGKNWLEVGGAHRPSTGDLEGVSTAFDGKNVHILHQTSDDVLYHRFRTSAHANADTWELSDEVLASPSEPPVQMSDIALRSDGSIVGVYSDLHKVMYKIRSSSGEWGKETVIDAESARDLTGPSVVTGKNDVVHFAYTGFDGTAWYRRILANGEVTPAQQVAKGLGTETDDAGGIVPLTYSASTDSVSIIYRLANGELWEKRVNSAGELSDAAQVTSRSVVTNAADSEQAGADALAFGDEMHVLYIEDDTGHLYHTTRDANTSWTEPKLILDDEDVLWVRGQLIKHSDGKQGYGFVYDGGSHGGSGFNRFLEIPLGAM